LFLFGFITAQGQTANLFQINGTISGMPDVDQVFLRYIRQGKVIVDTVKINEDTYAFTGSIFEPQAFTLWVTYKPTAKKTRTDSDQANLFLADGMINLSSANNFNNMEVSGEGGIWNKDYSELLKQEKISKDSADYWAAKFSAVAGKVGNYEKAAETKQKLTYNYSYTDYKRDSTELENCDNGFGRQKVRLRENVMIPYIRSKPNSPVALYALRIASEVTEQSVVKPYKLSKSLFDQLATEIKNSPSAKSFVVLLDKAAKTEEGKPAPEINLPDVDGNFFSLSSLKGKYVLVHFWASWCAPCRGANPALKKIYEKYKDKGFEVMAISIDESKQNWLQAVEEDNMPWHQVRDDKHEIGRLYQVGGIPRNFLIGPDGTVITRTLEDNSLEKKLQALFAK
jgi:peroxiredoxin